MKDVSGYIAEINRLKEKYKKDIEIYLGIEEDCSQLCDRSLFEYVIGSCHYVKIGGRYYSIDGSCEEFNCILQLFQNDPVKLAEEYYKGFCDYIISRKPVEDTLTGIVTAVVTLSDGTQRPIIAPRNEIMYEPEIMKQLWKNWIMIDEKGQVRVE